jgi:hypothetical protein
VLIVQARERDGQALGHLFEQLYPELRRIAHSRLRRGLPRPRLAHHRLGARDLLEAVRSGPLVGHRPAVEEVAGLLRRSTSADSRPPKLYLWSEKQVMTTREFSISVDRSRPAMRRDLLAAAGRLRGVSLWQV